MEKYVNKYVIVVISNSRTNAVFSWDECLAHPSIPIQYKKGHVSSQHKLVKGHWGNSNAQKVGPLCLTLNTIKIPISDTSNNWYYSILYISKSNCINLLNSNVLPLTDCLLKYLESVRIFQHWVRLTLAGDCVTNHTSHVTPPPRDYISQLIVAMPPLRIIEFTQIKSSSA